MLKKCGPRRRPTSGRQSQITPRSPSPRDPAKRGGTVVVKPPDFERVGRGLGDRGVICDWRPDVGLRLGPHFFNTDDELRFAVEQIVELSGRAARSAAARS